METPSFLSYNVLTTIPEVNTALNMSMTEMWKQLSRDFMTVDVNIWYALYIN